MPVVTAPGWEPSASPPISYKPIAARAAWVRALLAANVVTSALAAIVLSLALVVHFRGVNQPRFDSRYFHWADGMYFSTLAISGLLFAVTGVVFLAWLRRSYRNLIAMGTPGLRHKPGWAVGAWFVPLLNLARPIEIVNDLWRSSDPELPAGDAGWYSSRPPRWFSWWWACWLATSVIGGVASRIPEDTFTGFRVAVVAGVVSEVFGIPAALLGMRVVADVTRRQRQRAVRFARHEFLPREFAVAEAT